MQEFAEQMQILDEQRQEIAGRRAALEKSIQIKKDLESKLIFEQKKNAEEELKNIKIYREKMKARYKQYEEIMEISGKSMEMYIFD